MVCSTKTTTWGTFKKFMCRWLQNARAFTLLFFLSCYTILRHLILIKFNMYQHSISRDFTALEECPKVGQNCATITISKDFAMVSNTIMGLANLSTLSSFLRKKSKEYSQSAKKIVKKSKENHFIPLNKSRRAFFDSLVQDIWARDRCNAFFANIKEDFGG